jgi:trimeric autotransporter adhesin
MKAIKIILIITSIILLFQIELYSQAPTNGLIAYYPFTGNANDASGNGRNGVTSGGILQISDRNGYTGQAYAFNGSNSKIAIPSLNQLAGNSPRTISLWFKTNGFPNSFQWFLGWGAFTNSQLSLLGTHVNGTDRNLGFTGYSNDLNTLNQAQYYDNRWHQMVFSFDGNIMKLFLDGVLVNYRTTTLNTTNTGINIGCSVANNEYFNGSLDEIRFYNRSLSDNEVQQMYLAEVPATTNSQVIKLGTEKFIHTTLNASTFIGIRSGVFSDPNTATCTFIGYETGIANAGFSNSFLGFKAGFNNLQGGDNTFIGFLSGLTNIDGSYNLFLGNKSGGFGLNAASLQRSVAIGYNAKVSINDAIVLGDTANVNLKVGIGTTRPGNSFELRSATPNTSGLRLTNLTSNSPTLASNGKGLSVNNLGDIVLVPMSSGNGTNTHSDSVFVRTVINTNFTGGNLGVGVNTPQYKLDVNGDINISVGRVFKIGGNTFLKAQSISPFNTNIGFNSANAITTGSANTYLGFSSGYETTTGSSNTFIGTQAGYSNSSGIQNTFIGLNAGGVTFVNNLPIRTNITGNYNIFIGASSNPFGANLNSLQRSGAVGYNARVSVNDALVFGDFENLNFKIGIGMHDPQFKLDVKGPINIRGINGGLGELKFMSYNFLRGDNNFNSAIGFMAEVDSQYVHSTAIGYKSYATANNVLVLGGINENVVNVGIGNTSPKDRLEITSGKEGNSGLMFTNLNSGTAISSNTNQVLSVDNMGRVGLYGISADKIKLKINSENAWADKVFSSTYKLMPIGELEKYVQNKQHLPNIPSATEMKEKGISVESMAAKTIEKVEELTLYLIRMEKELMALKQENLELRKLVEKK